MRAVSAPTVVIIAAGEGTRMRSALPKVLHPLCGRPLILWPVDGRAGGRRRQGRRGGQPEAAARGLVAGGVALAVQPVPNGTGGAVAAADEHIDPEATVVVINGDVPLITPEAIKALVDAHEASGAAATMATMELDDPAEYGRVIRDEEGTSSGSWRPRRGDATPSSSRSARSTPASTRSTAPSSRRAQPIDTDNAQGELYLPDTLPKLRDPGKTIAAHMVTDHTLTLGVNDRVELEQVRKLAQRRINEWHARNGVTIVDLDTAHIDVEVTSAATR